METTPFERRAELVNHKEGLAMTESELIARLERLERDSKRLKRLGGAAVFVVAVGCAIYAASCSFVRTGGNVQTADCRKLPALCAGR